MDFFSLKQTTAVSIKQVQHLRMSTEMQQALQVLQLPILELSEWLKLEIEQNPVLEFDFSEDHHQESFDDLCRIEYNDTPLFEESDAAVLLEEKKRKAYQEGLLTYPTSLQDHLNEQARWTFQDPIDLQMAEQIIGSLDMHGFINGPLSDVDPSVAPERLKHILTILQSFDPPGICARNLQESLLIQLKRISKEHSISFKIIQNHFDDLLTNRLQLIARKQRLPIQTIHQIIQKEISPLNFHPSNVFYHAYPHSIIPDLYLEQEEEGWKIHINHSPLPRFQITPIYQQIPLAPEEKKYVEQHLRAGKWLKKIVIRRQDILLAIAQRLIHKQALFLNGDHKTLVPMTLKDIATELNLHESTIARAIANKYLHCPQGIFSIRSFFTQGLTSDAGQRISNQTVKQLMTRLIAQEDKRRPLSDEQIATEFQQMGICCARRTIAKYRQKMHIAAASKRRRWLL